MKRKLMTTSSSHEICLAEALVLRFNLAGGAAGTG